VSVVFRVLRYGGVGWCPLVWGGGAFFLLWVAVIFFSGFLLWVGGRSLGTYFSVLCVPPCVFRALRGFVSWGFLGGLSLLGGGGGSLAPSAFCGEFFVLWSLAF